MFKCNINIQVRSVVGACAIFALSHCSSPPVQTDAGSDMGVGSDSSMDVAQDMMTPSDSQSDTGNDSGSLHPLRPGCSPTEGIECDGDWASECDPPCSADQCCSPQNSIFRCVPRDTDGYCPAANLFVDESKIQNNVSVEWQYFPADDCALVERCVNGPGWRRLLRFDTWTPNNGTADMFLGPVNNSPYPFFEYSSCHRHYHFNSYAEYELTSSTNMTAATGHKQAFCLLDYFQYPMPPGMGAENGYYNCGFQGIQRGWQDVYERVLDCQWIDVTDVPAGDYDLHIRLNTQRILNETNYNDNDATISVNIPPDTAPDLTRRCEGNEFGITRTCEFVPQPAQTCTPGNTVRVGCSSVCGQGTCTGDPLMIVCPGDGPCRLPDALGFNDDSGASCGSRGCPSAGGAGCCPQVQFTCPPSGQYRIYWGANTIGERATCTFGMPLEEPPTQTDAGVPNG